MRRTIHFHLITCMSFLLLKCARSDHERFLRTYPLRLNNTDTKIACKQLFEDELEEHAEKTYALQLTATTEKNVEEVQVDERIGKYFVDGQRKSNHIISSHRTTDFLSNTREFRKSRNRLMPLERRMNEKQQLRTVHPRREQRRTITRNRNQGRSQFGHQNDIRVLDSRITSDGRMCVNRLPSNFHAGVNNIEYHRTAENERNLIKRKSTTKGNKYRQLITRREERINDESVNFKSPDHFNMDRLSQNDNRRERKRYVYGESQFRQEERRGRRLESSPRLKLDRLQIEQLGSLPSVSNDNKNIEKRRILPYNNEKNILPNANGYNQRVRILTERNDYNRESDDAHNNARSVDRMARTAVRYYPNIRVRAIRRNSIVRREKESKEFRIRIQGRRDNSVHKHFQTRDARMKFSSTDDGVFTHQTEPTSILTRGRRIRSDEEGTHPVHKGERYIVGNRPVFITELPEKGDRRENIRNERFNEHTSRISIHRDKYQDSTYRQRRHDNFLSEFETERRGQYQYDNRIRKGLFQKRYDHERDDRVTIVNKRDQFSRGNGPQGFNVVDLVADDKLRLKETLDHKRRRPTIDRASRRIDGSKLLARNFDIFDQNGITRAIVIGFVGIIGRGIWQKQC